MALAHSELKICHTKNHSKPLFCTKTPLLPPTHPPSANRATKKRTMVTILSILPFHESYGSSQCVSFAHRANYMSLYLYTMMHTICCAHCDTTPLCPTNSNGCSAVPNFAMFLLLHFAMHILLHFVLFLAALAALYLTLVSESVSQSLTATLEF